jgi:membrane protein
MWCVIQKAASEFIRDNCILMSAALAFYTALSFAPLMLLSIWAMSLLGGYQQQAVLTEIRTLAGPEAGRVAALVLDNAQQRPVLGTAAGWVSIALLLISATTVFAELQYALNTVWDVRPRDGFILDFVYKRLLGVAMIAVLLIVAIASMTFSATVAWLSTRQRGPGVDWLWQVVHLGGAIALFTAVFAVVFKALPDARVPWRAVLPGALVAGALFVLGRYPVSYYLAYTGVGSAYGAAGALMVLMMWVYYSWTVVFVGAEFGHALARHRHDRVVPEPGAEPAGEKLDERDIPTHADLA